MIECEQPIIQSESGFSQVLYWELIGGNVDATNLGQFLATFPYYRNTYQRYFFNDFDATNDYLE